MEKTLEVFVETGEAIERALTKEEIAQRKADQAAYEAAIAAAEAEAAEKEAKRATVLAALAAATGLEVDEIKAAIG